MSSWFRAESIDTPVEPPIDSTDGDLVTSAIEVPTTFDRLYMCHRDTIRRYAMYRLGNWHDSEDVTQQVFVDAFRNLNQFGKRDESFRGWLLRIAHNEICNRSRKGVRLGDTSLLHAERIAATGMSLEKIVPLSQMTTSDFTTC